MGNKPKCSQCNERDVFSKGLCSGCYGKNWRLQRKQEREPVVEPKQLTSGITKDGLEPAVIEGEIVHDAPPSVPDPHLVALNPAEMAAARGDMKTWLEAKLTVIERDIVEANAALNEARKNGWATGALTSARNRAVDDETFYNKILMAVEAGHTLIPEFPIEVFAIRRHEEDKREERMFNNIVSARDTGLARPTRTDCAPAGAGAYRNPLPWMSDSTRENLTPGAKERGEPRYYTNVYRSGSPVGPIVFPSMTARSPIMKATAAAMEEKIFDQVGVCLPVENAARGRVGRATRRGDPLVIGQILRKNEGGRQKCVSFIIAWYLNLEDL